MLTSIWDDVKRQFSYGNMVTRLIIVNVGVYLLVNLVYVFSYHGQAENAYTTFIQWLSMSSDIKYVLMHPWIIITSMFLHEGFMHILFNMLFLYWFGRIVGDLIGNQRILPIYLLGGIVGGIAYFLSANLLPPEVYGIGSWALGASAGVMAIVMASGVLAPDYSMHLILIGPVKLKYIVAVLVFLDVVATAGNVNSGGAFAHLGGAFMGWLFVYQLRQGKDLSEPINNTWNKIVHFFQNLSSNKKSKPARKVRVAYKNKGFARGHAASDREVDLSHQEQLDAILDKIKQTGYDSLTDEEKEFLFKASKK